MMSMSTPVSLPVRQAVLPVGSQRAAAKLAKVVDSVDNQVANEFTNGVQAFHDGQTPTVVAGTVARGSTHMYMSTSLNAIPELIQQLRQTGIQKPSMLHLGDALGASALTSRIFQAYHHLRAGTTPRKAESLTRDELLKLGQQLPITRLDINPAMRHEEDKVLAKSFQKHPNIGPKRLKELEAIRGHFVGKKNERSKHDVQPGSLLANNKNRKLLLGEVKPHDLRSDKPLPKSHLVDFGQILHYFSTVPPQGVDPKKEIPMSERAKLFKKVTSHEPLFVLFDGLPWRVGREEGVHASMLANGYVPEKTLSGKYARKEGCLTPLDQSPDYKPTQYAIYRRDPEQANAIRSNKATRIQRAVQARRLQKEIAKRIKNKGMTQLESGA